MICKQLDVQSRHVEVGVLVTANGITGNPTDLAAAHPEIVIQQAKGRRIVVATLKEIKLVATTKDSELLLLECLMAIVGLTRQ